MTSKFITDGIPSIGIIIAVCDACRYEHPEWSEEINAAVKAAHPIWPLMNYGIPESKAAIDMNAELWRTHQEKCIAFENEGSETKICSKHLHELTRYFDSTEMCAGVQVHEDGALKYVRRYEIPYDYWKAFLEFTRGGQKPIIEGETDCFYLQDWRAFSLNEGLK